MKTTKDQLIYNNFPGFSLVDEDNKLPGGFLVEGSRDIDLTRKLGALAKRRGIEAQLATSLEGSGIKGIHTYRRSSGDILLFGHGTDCYKLSGQEYNIEKTTTEDFDEGTHDDTCAIDNSLIIDPALVTPVVAEILYDYGTENVGWGKEYGSGEYFENPDHMRLYAYHFSDSESVGIVTDDVLDLTNVDVIRITWANEGSNSDFNRSGLLASPSGGGTHVNISKGNKFTTTVDELDVSTLTGDCHIRIQADANLDGVASDIRVYKIETITNNGYNTTAIWESPSYDTNQSNVTAALSWNENLPANTDIVMQARGSNDNQNWGDWQAVASSGDGIPLTRYKKIRATLIAEEATDTPSLLDLTITFTTAADTATEIKGSLTGNTLRFADYEDVCYFVDGGRPQRYDGSAVSNVGVDPPGTAPTIADSGMAGSPNGIYKARVTFVNEYGAESNGGVVSSSLSVSSKQISWSNIPTGLEGTKSRKLYRTKSGGNIYYLVDVINDNATTTYVDNIGDANLISGELETDNNIPPNSVIIHEHNNQILYVDADNPSSIKYSKGELPDSVYSGGGKVFPGPVLGVREFQNATIIGGQNFTIAALSTLWSPSENLTKRVISRDLGPVSHEAMVECFTEQYGDILIFPTRKGLNFLTPGLQENSLKTIPLSQQVQPIFDGAVNKANMAAWFDKGRYILALNYYGTDTPVQTNNIILVLDLRTFKWSPPWYIPSSGFCEANGSVYFGSPTIGQIYKFEAGTSDDGENIHAIGKLKKEYTPYGASAKKRLKEIWLATAEGSDTTTLQIKPSIDGTSETITPGNFDYTSGKQKVSLSRGYVMEFTIEDDSINDWIITELAAKYIGPQAVVKI